MISSNYCLDLKAANRAWEAVRNFDSILLAYVIVVLLAPPLTPSPLQIPCSRIVQGISPCHILVLHRLLIVTSKHGANMFYNSHHRLLQPS